MDAKIFKAKNRESGTLTATLLAATVNSSSLTPVPAYAPGVIVLRPGTAFEEHIYYKTRDAGAGTISGLTRDYTNLNGGTGFEHTNGSAWETQQASEYINNMVDALLEGYAQEQATIAYVGATSFTVLGDVTAFYTAGRILRANQDNTKILIVASSSYNGGTGLTTVTTNYGTVPTPLTHVEIGIMPKAATSFYALVSSMQNGSYLYAADSGGSDAYAITLAPAITAYTAGQVIFFKANTINTGAATLNVNGVGAKTIVKGGAGALALDDGDIPAGAIVAVSYDGTNMQLLGAIPTTIAGRTFTGATLTAPKVGTSINDTNGNEIIKTPATASAVNEITVTNAATGVAPIISATGDDANIHLAVTPKGNGLVKIAVLRQDYTANTYVPSTIILTGWGWKLGDAGTAMTSAVTFGISFASVPIVVAGANGQKSGSNPATVGELTGQPGYYLVESFGLATGGFTIGMTRTSSQTFTNTMRYGYTWIAIGVL